MEAVAQEGSRSPRNIWNAADVMRRFGDDRELVIELIEIFKRSASKLIASLLEAAAKRDLFTGRHVAHSLKGAAGNLAAEQITETAAILETSAGMGDMKTFLEYVNRLPEQMARLETAFTMS